MKCLKQIKALPFSIIFILVSIPIGISSAHAGWSENVRLTFRGNEISPQVIARGDTVHVVWFEMGRGHVSYIRSTDGGNTWGNIFDLNAPGHPCPFANPTLNLAERGLLVSWFDTDSSMGITTIGIRKSTNNGRTWDNVSYVYTDNPDNFGNPVSAVKGDSIFLVYRSLRDDSTGLAPFRSMHSYNYGAAWSDEVTVGHPLAVEGQPIRMKYCHGALLFAYAGVPDSASWGHDYIIGHRSIDAGRTWSDTIWISPHMPYDPQALCLSCNPVNYSLSAGYMDYRNVQYAFHGDIFAAISNDGGLTWPNEYQTTNNHTAWWPQLNFVADTLITVWSDMRYDYNGVHEIVLNRSNDGGNTWQGEQRITNTPDESYDPWISFDRGKIHVVWTEDVPNSGYEIFYKKFTPDSTDNIEEPDLSTPSNFSLSAYPNPFNSSITITVRSNESGILDIYNIEGRVVNQYLYERGVQRIIWDAKTSANQPLSSGTYFIGRKGGEKNTIKVVYVK